MSERRAITFFSEDRLATNAHGEVVSPDPDLARGGWARGLPDPSAAYFAARLDSGEPTDGYPVVGCVVGLPYYEGGVGLVRQVPAMVLAVWRAVFQSSAVAVRLPGAVGLLAVMAAVVLRRRIVIELVGDIHEVLSSGVGGRLGPHLAMPLARLTQWAVRQGDVVRYVTQSRLQESYPPGAAAQVLAFSDVVLREEDFDAPTVAADSAARVIAVGSQEQLYKGHDLLIAALGRLRRAGHDINLVLLGQGRCQAELRAQASSLGISEHVHFMGHLSPRSAVRDEVDRSWVFAMPSRTEGLPRALVEAMARGKPCVVSNVGGMPELIDPALVFSRDDVDELSLLLEGLIADEQLRRAQGDRNRQAALGLWNRRDGDVHRWQSALDEVAGGTR